MTAISSSDSIGSVLRITGKEGGSVETEWNSAEEHASAHLATYHRPDLPWSAVKQAIRRLGVAAVAKETGIITPRGLRNSLQPHVNPRASTKLRLTEVTAAHDFSRSRACAERLSICAGSRIGRHLPDRNSLVLWFKLRKRALPSAANRDTR